MLEGLLWTEICEKLVENNSDCPKKVGCAKNMMPYVGSFKFQTSINDKILKYFLPTLN